MTSSTQHAQNPDYNYCALPLASYACRPDESKGRLYEAPENSDRTVFQRDRDRIIHASAFRRLKYKTQVFVYDEGDHYRTRLTHTLEVAQITRSLARALFVNEDLAEGIALAHDLGHTPFAHLGEEALRECMKDYGGFDHNDQSLRILVLLERTYPEWSGLNLTWETLEGVVKHNGPLYTSKTKKDFHVSDTLKHLEKLTDLRFETYASVEAQVAALSDDIAYNNHDIEDGLRADLFTLDDLRAIPLVAKHIEAVETQYPDISAKMTRREIVRRLIGEMVRDVTEESRARLKALPEQSVEAVRMNDRAVVAFSDSMLAEVNKLRAFLYERMYKHPKLNRISFKVRRILTQIFEAYIDNPAMLPVKWQERMKHGDEWLSKPERARHICDYIAGMTDRFAIKLYQELFQVDPDPR
ncbi:MAG: deoxyguanosinetriphosphate triphosphohydrolase [Micavibrio sp.]|nr:deoxyguanosinetriphosphate triphosphohydrolase [Micavibrio sp.]|tara:strand:- start:38113 stop:39351 length:1239 start_codon:yes stop_codon:yes gene_type:complete